RVVFGAALRIRPPAGTNTRNRSAPERLFRRTKTTFWGKPFRFYSDERYVLTNIDPFRRTNLFQNT
ncbi:MAG TPA: hypothetical protein PKA58_33290, partial [Polyangium sp.]|nr:hypothetical protein [Polyangium sp.]